MRQERKGGERLRAGEGGREGERNAIANPRASSCPCLCAEWGRREERGKREKEREKRSFNKMRNQKLIVTREGGRREETGKERRKEEEETRKGRRKRAVRGE